MPARLALLVLSLASGCGTCGSGIDSLRAEEPSPHVRCLAGEPPEEGTRALGEQTIEIEARTLRFVGDDPLRFAAFSGPAPGRADIGLGLATVREAEVDFVVVLGDLGDDEATLRATLSALSSLERPVLLVPGGRDEAETLAAGLSALDEDVRPFVVDASGLDRIVVGTQSLIPIAGAPGGRYGRTDGACGFTEEDLDGRASRLDDVAEGERRYLLSWAAPSGGIAVGIGGADAGDPALGAFAESIAAAGGLFAWPREAAGRVLGETPNRSEVVRRIVGPVAERGDGERPPVGPSIFTLGPDGLSSP